MKILAAALFPDRHRLEIYVEDDDGKRRRHDYMWKAAGRVPLPSHWLDILPIELDLVRAHERDVKAGRILP